MYNLLLIITQHSSYCFPLNLHQTQACIYRLNSTWCSSQVTSLRLLFLCVENWTLPNPSLKCISKIPQVLGSEVIPVVWQMRYIRTILYYNLHTNLVYSLEVHSPDNRCKICRCGRGLILHYKNFQNFIILLSTLTNRFQNINIVVFIVKLYHTCSYNLQNPNKSQN